MTNEQKRTALAKFGIEILYKKSLIDGLPLISKYAKMIIAAERCSMFIYDEENNELWTTLADGVEKLIIPSDKGLIGETLRTKKAIICKILSAYWNESIGCLLKGVSAMYNIVTIALIKNITLN